MSLRSPWLFIATLAWVVPALAAEIPTLDRVLNPVILRGQSSLVQFAGKNWTPSVGLWHSGLAPHDPSLKAAPLASPSNVLQFTLNIPAATPLGPLVCRLMGPQWLSPPVLLWIDDMKSVSQLDPGMVRQVQTLQIPAAVQSQCVEGEVWQFEVQLHAGQPFSAEVISRRLGSPGDPLLRLYGPDGVELAMNAAIPGLSVDARIDFIPNLSGNYRLRLHEARHRGGSNFPFLLRIGRIPTQTPAFPTAEQRISSPNAGQSKLPCDGMGSVRMDAEVQDPGSDGSITVRRRLSCLSERHEVEPNDVMPQATELGWDVGVSGRLDRSRDQDWYAWEGRAGERVEIRMFARSLGSACDPWFRLWDARSNVIATATLVDASEPSMIHEIKESGRHWIQVRDAAWRGSTSSVYRLELLRKPNGEPKVKVEPFFVEWTNGLTAELSVKVDRHGAEGEIRLEAEEALEGVEWEGAVIPAGRSEGKLKWTLKTRWKPELDSEWRPGMQPGRAKLGIKWVRLWAVTSGAGEGTKVGTAPRKVPVQSGAASLGLPWSPMAWEQTLYVAFPDFVPQ